MPSPNTIPLGPVWVRVVACFFGMSFMPLTLIAICLAPGFWVISVGLPSSAGICIYSAHTLHTGKPPPISAMLRYLVGSIYRRREKHDPMAGIPRPKAFHIANSNGKYPTL